MKGSKAEIEKIERERKDVKKKGRVGATLDH